MKTENKAVDINRNIGDFFYPEAHVRDAGAGLSERTVRYISEVKEDPDWVREFRLRGLKKYPEIFRKWFGKVIPIADNKFSALNSAVFSGGSFIYVPPGVKVKHPLQAYFRINAENFGQFERTLIIADEGSEVT